MLLLVLLLAAALPIHILRSPLSSACRDGRMMLMRDVLMSSPQHAAIVSPVRAVLLRSGSPQDPGLLLFIYTLMNYVQPWNLARVYMCPRAADRQSRRSNKVRLPDLSLIVSPPPRPLSPAFLTGCSSERAARRASATRCVRDARGRIESDPPRVSCGVPSLPLTPPHCSRFGPSAAAHTLLSPRTLRPRTCTT